LVPNSPTPFFKVGVFIIKKTMKIIITEGQYNKLKNQEYIDNLLDKINKYYNKLDLERKVKALALETERLN
jgi:hypothetical protein